VCPILVSHKGKLVALHTRPILVSHKGMVDGSMTDYATGQPVKHEPDKRPPPAPKRWHDPY
jgi:hypothetical protein